MIFFDTNTDNMVYYIAAIIFLIILYIMHRLEKRDKRRIQLDIDEMLELDIRPRRKGDKNIRAEFERRRRNAGV